MSDPTELELVEAVRSFNCFYTAVVGLLGDGLLRTPYSLTEARGDVRARQARPNRGR
jgi:hypothetical protein